MTDTYRAMCAELLAALEIQLDELRFNNRLCVRARALLAQPVAEGPTNETPWEIDDDDFLLFSPANAMAFQAQKRSRRRRPTPQPVEVAPLDKLDRLIAFDRDNPTPEATND